MPKVDKRAAELKQPRVPRDPSKPRLPGGDKVLTKRDSRFTKKQKVLVGLTITVALTVSAYFLFLRPTSQPETIKISKTTLKSTQNEKIYSPLTGAEVSEEKATRPLTGIMIENSVDARPQSGLSEAGIVFEAIAEGGITRFATVYQENTPEEVGPVRSLRPYYLDWLRPFDATISHVGGSQKALKSVRDGTWKDMDQFANGKSFWRSKERKAPHNVYTSFEKIDDFNKSKDYKLEEFSSFARKDDQKSSSPTASTINFNISLKLYNSIFTYNPDKNDYLRSQGGAPHLDKSGIQIEPKVVVALISSYSIVQEDGSRSAYKTTGSGEAVVFQDGTATLATWAKTDQKSQIKLTDSTGTEIKLNRGQTWFTVLSSKDKLSYK